MSWDVAPWGAWRVTAKTPSHEIVVVASAEPLATDPGTVLRAPQAGGVIITSFLATLHLRVESACLYLHSS